MSKGGDTDPLTKGPRLESLDVNALLQRLPPDQVANLDIPALYQMQLSAAAAHHAATERGAERRRRDSIRLRALVIILVLIAAEFAAGAAILVWASEESWSDVKDLLAYGLAPLAALAALGGSYYFPTQSSDA